MFFKYRWVGIFIFNEILKNCIEGIKHGVLVHILSEMLTSVWLFHVDVMCADESPQDILSYGTFSARYRIMSSSPHACTLDLKTQSSYRPAPLRPWLTSPRPPPPRPSICHSTLCFRVFDFFGFHEQGRWCNIFLSVSGLFH